MIRCTIKLKHTHERSSITITPLPHNPANRHTKMNSEILSVEELLQPGVDLLQNVRNPNERNLMLTGELINPKFSAFRVLTSMNEIQDVLKHIHNEPIEEVKHAWVICLKDLTRFSSDELIKHYNKNNKIWKEWCSDVVMWYCYNAIVFKKGIPVITASDE